MKSTGTETRSNVAATQQTIALVDASALSAEIFRAVQNVIAAQAAEKLMLIQPQRTEKPARSLPAETTVSGKLWRMYDNAGPALTVAGARELAAQAGLNLTSAEISFYNWRKNRTQRQAA